jgi:hypothetical protein
MLLSWVGSNNCIDSVETSRWAISAEDIEGDESGIRMSTLYGLIMCPFWSEHMKINFGFRVCWSQNRWEKYGLRSFPIVIPQLPWSAIWLEWNNPLVTAIRESDVVLEVWDLTGR